MPWIVDVVLGGQDGLVNVLGLILGVAGATSSSRIVLVAGLAGAFAESISMAAVAYTSAVARGELFKSESARERRHIGTVPGVERDEIRAIYARKGFEGDLLDRIVATITANEDVWVAVMMAEEHGLTDVDRRASVRSAVIVGIASLVGSLLPLLPFVFLSVSMGAIVSLTLSALTLFALGAYKAKVTIGRPWKGGIQLAAIGIISAVAGYAVGVLLRVPGAP